MKDSRANSVQSSGVPEVCDGVATDAGAGWDDIALMIAVVGLTV
jgi:hypothetical protein